MKLILGYTMVKNGKVVYSSFFFSIPISIDQLNIIYACFKYQRLILKLFTDAKPFILYFYLLHKILFLSNYLLDSMCIISNI